MNEWMGYANGGFRIICVGNGNLGGMSKKLSLLDF